MGIVPVKNSALGDAIDDGAVAATLAPEPYAAKLEAAGTVVPVADANAQIARWKIPATVLVVTAETGSGKTTLLRAMANAAQPTSGTVTASVPV